MHAPSALQSLGRLAISFHVQFQLFTRIQQAPMTQAPCSCSLNSAGDASSSAEGHAKPQAPQPTFK